ncbi:MAG: 50S ribosomal protein L23 [Alphaproteobacteria bacterium]
MKKRKLKNSVSEQKIYDIVRSPLVTEKTTRVGEHNQVAFEVSKSATKPEIKAAVEHVFDVKVKSVNTLVSKGKTKRWKGMVGKRSDVKKAYVTLEAGHSIDVVADLG